jgi:hypothetical protein
MSYSLCNECSFRNDLAYEHVSHPSCLSYTASRVVGQGGNTPQQETGFWRRLYTTLHRAAQPENTWRQGWLIENWDASLNVAMHDRNVLAIRTRWEASWPRV